jgi:hypothetical protein
LSLSAIVGELKAIGARLDRTATAAEMGGAHPIVVSAAAQQIRLNESKARLAGHGGFAPARARDGAGEVPVFNLTIHLGDGRKEEIVATPLGGEVIENDPLGPLPSWFGERASLRGGKASSGAPEAEIEDEFEEDV